MSERNFTPTSAPFGSPESALGGETASPQIEQGQLTLTVRPAPGASVLALSSLARVWIVVAGWPCTIHVYVQLEVPEVAGCHVLPPSVETSTPAMTPPPPSVAVPVIMTLVPSVRLAPAAGDVIVDVGFVVSV